MPPLLLDRLRSHATSRAARWAALAAVVLVVLLGSYLRLSSTVEPDVSRASITAVEASSEPVSVCEGPREDPGLTGDLGAASWLHAARPPSGDEADSPRTRLRFRDGGPTCGVPATPAWALGRTATTLATRSFARKHARIETATRKRARLMVFLN